MGMGSFFSHDGKVTFLAIDKIVFYLDGQDQLLGNC